MKKILGVILLTVIIIGLSACGKGEDMSGTYYFERGVSASNEIGKITLSKASEDGTVYNALETTPDGVRESEGEFVLNDNSYLDINMPLSGVTHMYDGGIYLDEFKGAKYEFKKGVLTLGEEVEFHRDDTNKGKELQKFWSEGTSDDELVEMEKENTWENNESDDEFEEIEKENAWESNGSDNEDSYTTDAEEYYSNSCAACHGNDLTGGMAPDISSVGSNLSAEEIESVIIDGLGAMPSGTLPEDEARVVAEWLSEMK